MVPDRYDRRFIESLEWEEWRVARLSSIVERDPFDVVSGRTEGRR